MIVPVTLNYSIRLECDARAAQAFVFVMLPARAQQQQLALESLRVSGASAQSIFTDATTATQQVYTALAEGRSYVVNRLEGAAPALSFTASRGDECYTLGDSVASAPGPLLIEADVGANAYVRLIADGKVLTSGVRHLRQSVVAGTVYRLEAYIGGKLWLFTNPIYVTG